MVTFYRLGTIRNYDIPINNLDEKLNKLGYILSNDGAFYYKKYSSKNNYLTIGVICDDHNIYDIMAFAVSNDNDNINKQLKSFEKKYQLNMNAITSLSMTKIAGGMGLEGGPSGMHNVNLDESFGGPRWWSYSSDEEDLNQLESWITKQSRYNPEYLSIGESVSIGENEYFLLGSIDNDIKSARLNRDRQKVYIEYIDKNNQKYQISIPSFKSTSESGYNDGDLAQEINKYQLKIVKMNNKSFIFMRKKDTRGDIRGIWEINGRDSTPGFAYIDEDWRTSFSMHPEFLSDPSWVSGAWSPGRNNYDQSSRII